MASTVAAKRLFTEYRTLTNDPPDGITAGPASEDDMFLWEALIQGPEGTPFEGGIFPAELKFPKDYPLAPPTMRFTCDMWHPNGASLLNWPSYGLSETDGGHSLPQRHGLHKHPARSWRRSKPLRARIRAMVTDSERREDTDKCDEHAC